MPRVALPKLLPPSRRPVGRSTSPMWSFAPASRPTLRCLRSSTPPRRASRVTDEQGQHRRSKPATPALTSLPVLSSHLRQRPSGGCSWTARRQLSSPHPQCVNLSSQVGPVHASGPDVQAGTLASGANGRSVAKTSGYASSPPVRSLWIPSLGCLTRDPVATQRQDRLASRRLRRCRWGSRSSMEPIKTQREVDVAAIRARLSAITEGPWSRHGSDVYAPGDQVPLGAAATAAPSSARRPTPTPSSSPTRRVTLQR